MHNITVDWTHEEIDADDAEVHVACRSSIGEDSPASPSIVLPESSLS